MKQWLCRRPGGQTSGDSDARALICGGRAEGKSWNEETECSGQARDCGLLKVMEVGLVVGSVKSRVERKR